MTENDDKEHIKLCYSLLLEALRRKGCTAVPLVRHDITTMNFKQTNSDAVEVQTFSFHLSVSILKLDEGFRNFSSLTYATPFLKGPKAPSPHITTRGSVPTHYHTKLRPHTLPHEAPSPHITTRGSVPTHYHMRLCPHTLPHEAPSAHITTRGSVLTHYHMRLHPHTLPHEAPSSHINTQGSVPPHYHTRLCPHTLPHEAPSSYITTRVCVPTHYHTRLCPHTLPHEAIECCHYLL
ncbi:unnamed protein product [Ranitomeya imitator]|uniref:Uncharacterized protein n=1 Tax=Ranitomeya imitator TaxID=111125 RepID=A0ABN9LJC7_9NEOB|nr:unnamed protein product [Ranitomeya imitator]